MTNEETIEVLDDMKIKIAIPKSAITQRKRNEALNIAIQALEQQPCEDCISREAVKKLKKYRLSYDTNTTIPKSDIFVKIADIEELSSVQPQRSKGKWIGCSICNRCNYKKMSLWRYNYCPNCGADMRESEE